jgi:hypothetical protein
MRGSRSRRLAGAAFVAVAAGLLASCGGKPWWSQTRSSACGPPALVRVGGHVKLAGDCAGMLTIPALNLTVHVGQQIDVHVLAGPVPRSPRPSVLMPTSIGSGPATATYQGVRPGQAAVIPELGHASSPTTSRLG